MSLPNPGYLGLWGSKAWEFGDLKEWSNPPGTIGIRGRTYNTGSVGPAIVESVIKGRFWNDKMVDDGGSSIG